MAQETTPLDTGKQENGHVSENGPLRIDLRPTLLEAAPQSRIFSQRWYVVMMFSFTTALLFADQNLLAPNLSEAARDFGFNDKQKDLYLGGVVSIVFFLVGAPASIFIGYLMDKRDRRMLLWLCVVVGETPCMLTVFVREYWQLLLTRCLTGIAVGGATPLIYSILSDLYPPSERALITTLVAICTGAGTAIGQMLAGFLPFDWRVPFAIVAVVGVLIATAMVLTVRDPRRGAVEAALQGAFEASEDFQYDEKITWSKFANITRIPTNMLVILQGISGCLPWGMMMAYMTDYLIEDKGLSKGWASLVVVLFGAGGFLGGIGGGTLGQALYNWRKGYIAFLTGVSVWLGIPVLMWLVNGDIAGTPPVLTAIVTFLGGAMASVAGVTLRPIIMNVNEPETRGMALSMHATLDDIGKGFGPAVVASLISGMGRPAAFNVAVCGWIPCGIMLFSAGFFLERDEHAMQLRLLNAVQKFTDPSTPDGVELTHVHKDSVQVEVESLDVQ